MQYVPPTRPSMMVELSFSCQNLVKMDVSSKSDPMVIVFTRSSQGTSWTEIGRTEFVSNNLNPTFVKNIETQFFFEEQQLLRFLVVDVDNPEKAKHSDSKGFEYIGEAVCLLGKIMGNRGMLVEKLENEKHPKRENGSITIKAFEARKSNRFLHLRLSATKLDSKDTFSKSDPFVVIHRFDGNGGFAPVHKTEYIQDNENPDWKAFSIPLVKLCNENYDSPILVECWDWDDDGSNDLIGKFTTNLRELLTKKEFELIEPKIQQKKGSKYTNSGVLHVREAREYVVPTFLDYVMGGTEISLIVGIDFTGSNGDPSQSSSLHYRNPNGNPNEYMAAIRIIGDIVAPYDNDKLFPVFGFGGWVDTLKDTSHCFALNFDESNPNCVGVDGILQTYVNSFPHIKLSGPTHFAPILKRVNQMAAACQPGTKYTVLLMITDGEINDMPETISEIRKSTQLPLSVIVIGVGGADFRSMKVLDDDDDKLHFQRDVVQFVPFRQFASQPLEKLAKEVLAEVPQQLVAHMTQKNISPRPRPF